MLCEVRTGWNLQIKQITKARQQKVCVLFNSYIILQVLKNNNAKASDSLEDKILALFKGSVQFRKINAALCLKTETVVLRRWGFVKIIWFY